MPSDSCLKRAGSEKLLAPRLLRHDLRRRCEACHLRRGAGRARSIAFDNRPKQRSTSVERARLQSRGERNQ
eukprot:5931884-Pyramimonas_sp.AAC.1